MNCAKVRKSIASICGKPTGKSQTVCFDGSDDSTQHTSFDRATLLHFLLHEKHAQTDDMHYERQEKAQTDARYKEIQRIQTTGTEARSDARQAESSPFMHPLDGFLSGNGLLSARRITGSQRQTDVSVSSPQKADVGACKVSNQRIAGWQT